MTAERGLQAAVAAYEAFYEGMTPDGLGPFPENDTEVDEFVDECTAWTKQKDASESKVQEQLLPVDPSSLRFSKAR